MRLPFASDCLVVPNASHDGTVRITLRDYTDVFVQDVEAADLRIAIVRRDAPDGVDEYFDHGGRLFRRAKNSHGDETLTRDPFQIAVSATPDRRSTDSPRSNVAEGFDVTRYPQRGWYREGGSINPLLHPTGETAKRKFRWDDTWRFEGSRHAEIGMAQEWLSKRVLSVNGEVYLASVEPVWTVAPSVNGTRDIRFDPQPKLAEGLAQFRLDRLSDAVEWVSRLGDTVASIDDVDISASAMFSRSDSWALGRSVACHWPPPGLHKVRGPAVEMVASLHDSVLCARRCRAAWSFEEAINVLGIVDQLAFAFEQARVASTKPGAETRFHRIAQRWRFETEHGDTLGPELSNDDLAALENLEFGPG